MIPGAPCALVSLYWGEIDGNRWRVSFRNAAPPPAPFARSLLHQALNQSKELTDYNMFLTDGALRKAVATFRGAWGESRLKTVGALAGSKDMKQLSRLVRPSFAKCNL
jgi:hypothetical protein